MRSLSIASLFAASNDKIPYMAGSTHTPASHDMGEHLTQTIKSALALIDVRVVDHVIVARPEALSFAERGLL